MSAFLLGIGFRADMGTCARKLVLLKLIDACEDDGSRIFPAIATIARAAQCSTRQVQRELQAFREIGLISLVREGGKGPRSTNEYALDLDLLTRLGREGWDAVAAGKGDTVSPLDEGEKGDTGDTKRVTPETDKGDIACHPTPPYPSIDPSIEREARAEDRKRAEAAFDRAWREWPATAAGSRDKALKAWLALEPDERAEAKAAVSRWIAAYRAEGREYLSAFSKYLVEKHWERLPEPEEARPAAVEAAPFGALWGAVRARALVLDPPQPGPPARGYVAELLARGDEAARRETLRRQASFGWPQVTRMHEMAESRKPSTVASGLAWMAALTEPVVVGSDLWGRWQAHHERMGWPWLPDPGRQRVAYFPAGGPEGLARFEQAAKDGTDDGGDHEAAA